MTILNVVHLSYACIAVIMQHLDIDKDFITADLISDSNISSIPFSNHYLLGHINYWNLIDDSIIMPVDYHYDQHIGVQFIDTN